MKSGTRKRGGAGTASAANRLQARDAMNALNAARPLRPRCGAKTRTTGGPCRDIAMASGKCFRHGGKTPKGKNWHRPQWPDGNAPNAERKLRRKLRKRVKAAEERAARLAAMSPEERAAHAAWHRGRRPGDPKERAADRDRLRQDLDGAAWLRGLAEKPREISSREQAVADELDALYRRRAELEAGELQPKTYYGGVFE